MIKPNLFIVGAPKCATTSVFNALASHPDINMSKTKEPHYFLPGDEIGNTFRISSSIKYQDQFCSGRRFKYYGEGSVSYMYSSRALSAIASVNPQAKIIICLRDPVQRMYSHWKMDVLDGKERKGFLEAVESSESLPNKFVFGRYNMYRLCSLYAAPIKDVLNIFPRENVKILVFEEIKENPRKALDDCLKWLRLDGEIQPIGNDNVAGRPKNSVYAFLMRIACLRTLGRLVLSENQKKKIRTTILRPDDQRITSAEYEHCASWFSDDIETLENLLQRRFSRWNKAKLPQ